MNILCYSERKKWLIHYKLTNKWKKVSETKILWYFFVNSETLVLNTDNSTKKNIHPLTLSNKSSNTKWYFT